MSDRAFWSFIAAIVAFLIFVSANSAKAASKQRWLLITSACAEAGKDTRCNTFNLPGFMPSEAECRAMIPIIEAQNMATAQNLGLAPTWAWSTCRNIGPEIPKKTA